MQSFDNFKRNDQFLKQNTTFQSYFTVKSTCFTVLRPPMTVLVVGQRLSTVLQHLNRQETLTRRTLDIPRANKARKPFPPHRPTHQPPPKFLTGAGIFLPLYSLTTLLKPCRRVAHHTCMALDSRTQRKLVIHAF